MSEMPRPILYSFRRCPYAMRARLAIAASGIEVELREIILREKPAAMLAASPKGTVPVLILQDGTVIDESLDIMHWALGQNDPQNWLSLNIEAGVTFIQTTDGPFKQHLDRYKYIDRYKDDTLGRDGHRAAGLKHLEAMNAAIETQGGGLCGPDPSLADIATFPFIRQFANTDRDWFDALPLPALQNWLAAHLTSERFAAIMKKYPQWKAGAPGIPFLRAA